MGPLVARSTSRLLESPRNGWGVLPHRFSDSGIQFFSYLYLFFGVEIFLLTFQVFWRLKKCFWRLKIASSAVVKTSGTLINSIPPRQLHFLCHVIQRKGFSCKFCNINS